jgi:hypothetical protein
MNFYEVSGHISLLGSNSGSWKKPKSTPLYFSTIRYRSRRSKVAYLVPVLRYGPVLVWTRAPKSEMSASSLLFGVRGGH